MKVIKIKKSIDIKAPKEKVWDILVKDEHTRKWYSAFHEGSHAVTDWKEGSKALFLDNADNGMLTRVITNKPGEELAVEYEGFILAGKEDFESEGAKALKGGIERYRLSGVNGSTNLDIESDMGEEWAANMEKQWDQALEKIKQMAEGGVQTMEIRPYLSFNGNCKGAMEFYRDCLGGELQIMKVSDTPVANQCPTGMQDQVMHAALMKNGVLLMGTDMSRSKDSTHGNTMAISLNCTTEAEIKESFERLSAGGEVIDQLNKAFWGGMFGVLKDKYGFVWMLNWTPEC